MLRRVLYILQFFRFVSNDKEREILPNKKLTGLSLESFQQIFNISVFMSPPSCRLVHLLQVGHPLFSTFRPAAAAAAGLIQTFSQSVHPPSICFALTVPPQPEQLRKGRRRHDDIDNLRLRLHNLRLHPRIALPQRGQRRWPRPPWNKVSKAA